MNTCFPNGGSLQFCIRLMAISSFVHLFFDELPHSQVSCINAQIQRANSSGPFPERGEISSRSASGYTATYMMEST